MSQKITHITVHCSAARPSTKETWKDIDRQHRMPPPQGKGFLMIGYHWFIRRDGTIEKGRPESMVGAHVADHNAGNIGICLSGGMNEAYTQAENNFTPAQLISLERVVKDVLSRYPGSVVLGHRDWPNVQKACPSFDVKSWWSGIQAKAN